MNRGSAALSRLSLPGDLSFNEAPIHESGKYDGTRLRQRGRLLLQ